MRYQTQAYSNLANFLLSHPIMMTCKLGVPEVPPIMRSKDAVITCARSFGLGAGLAE